MPFFPIPAYKLELFYVLNPDPRQLLPTATSGSIVSRPLNPGQPVVVLVHAGEFPLIDDAASGAGQATMQRRATSSAGQAYDAIKQSLIAVEQLMCLNQPGNRGDDLGDLAADAREDLAVYCIGGSKRMSEQRKVLGAYFQKRYGSAAPPSKVHTLFRFV
ncbi:hypothetical protein JCM11641_004379 [Rhodosporidiobolus odoratus]